MGVIHKIDIRTIEKVLLEAKNENYKGKLFFNLSPKVLVLKDFIESVTSIVKDIGFEPANMVFEITERDTVRSLDMLRNFTLSLRKEGFKFAIDDFGSGFSSFMYLKHIPVDFIKIEGEFIRSILKSRMDKALVASMLALADILEIQTIAEYVENEEIFKVVRHLGVNYIQGYYVGKPMPEIKV